MNNSILLIVDEEEDAKPENARETKLQKCKYLVNVALNEDEAGWKQTAVMLYIDAAQLALNTVSFFI